MFKFVDDALARGKPCPPSSRSRVSWNAVLRCTRAVFLLTLSQAVCWYIAWQVLLLLLLLMMMMMMMMMLISTRMRLDS